MTSPDGEDVSQLAERDLRTRLQKYHDELQQQQQEAATLPSLMSLAADQILQELEESKDLDLALSQLVEGLDPIALRLVLDSPKASYRLLRAFHDLRLDTGERAIDIDEAIKRNESYLRSRSNTDGAYLVSFGEFVDTLLDKLMGMRDDPHVKGKMTRGDYLGHGVGTELSANPDDDLFTMNVDVITSGLFKDLDWDNILLVGPLPLSTMMETGTHLCDEFSHTNHRSESIFYVYGLSREDGYRKVEHIHDTYVKNFAGPLPVVVVKSMGAISIVPDPPNHHVRIVLKVFHSPTDVLLDVNDDLQAVAFNGSSVYMLPRCAQAVTKDYPYVLSGGLHELSDSTPSRLQALMDTSLSDQIQFQRHLIDPLSLLDMDIDGFYIDAGTVGGAVYRDQSKLFGDMKQAICKRLGIQNQPTGVYQGYLTRRIRRHIPGNEFQALMDKQLTLPLFIPYELEDYLTNKLGEDYPEQASLVRESLIPVHDFENYDTTQPGLPSLTDTTTGYGNLRYWVITNAALWAGHDRVLDEVAETLRALHFLTTNASFNTDELSTAGPTELRRWYDFRQARNNAM